ncbi:Phenolphthiocerol synthesis polyketide synthase type I Pks15/1 [Vibrio ruber DSM 16370]|uniref:Phenolphthiocerol synthesis polyketide synthase type I Pks15/1 n=1 Tax=Vibrio ruber (strain DSM 16370 / JCM 11486 / BCRC 17186 / CECT 7878 / LMG 23124 / VR1) TaxID=1123498 RepID=A0A1R4LR32_VIBR1|nr:type I polyketide synthase [Vibrio ruber]SJN59050.1 Phenolphthiocerol synthesis polyketide synthase type I Pks15/1 [Vibrio ruber DSM 16370]
MRDNSQNDRQRLLKALTALEKMEGKLKSLTTAQNEPIAIVAVDCCFPGSVNDPDAYWQMLLSGEDAIDDIPEGRWSAEILESLSQDVSMIRQGGFIEQIEQFDAAFFGISPREAIDMDPRQRLLLETTWSALERGNLSPERLMGSNTGVFIGYSGAEYINEQNRIAPERVNGYMGTGSAPSVAAGRISYILGLKGPSSVVDTACSSSLVAVHMACESLRRDECKQAIVGAANLIVSPQTSIMFARSGMLSEDSRCKPFDDSANGYVRGEGCAVIILKRLSKAIADGNEILAVIKGSAVNHDGTSSGLTVPNVHAQEEVIRQALKNAGMTPDDIDYIEAHGTGTPLGDPIEVGALTSVFHQPEVRNRPLWIGSVKSNIGHLEVCAGMASLIKVVLALKNRRIPAHLHFHRPNTHIDWEDTSVQVVREEMAWPESGTNLPCAGVSAFGFSGTNVHMVISSAPDYESPLSVKEKPPREQILTLSAKSGQALSDLVQRYIDFLKPSNSGREYPLEHICYSANVGRTHFRHRLALHGHTHDSLYRQLQDFQKASLAQKTAPFSGNKDIVLLFTGQGSQYIGMGKELYDTIPYFRQVVDQCDAILQPILGCSILPMLWDESQSARIHQTQYTQPALFVLEYALTKLWQSWGIQPSAVVGHSVGEYAAACIAGVFSLNDALLLIAMRGKLMSELPGEGAMVAVMAPASDLVDIIHPFAESLSIAACNTPTQTVLSGSEDAMQQVLDILKQQDISAYSLEVSHAFHSPLMQPMLDEFRIVAERVTYHRPTIKIISNVTGHLADERLMSPEYWVEHVTAPVRFMESITNLQTQLRGEIRYLEVGPKPVLLKMVQQCFKQQQLYVLASIQPEIPDTESMMATLGQLYTDGASVLWQNFYQNFALQFCSLPTYAFQRQRFWFDSFTQSERPHKEYTYSSVATHSGAHPLSGKLLQSPVPIFALELSRMKDAFWDDHRVYDQVVIPGAAFLETGFAVAKAQFPDKVFVLEDMNIRAMLSFSAQDADPLHLQTVLQPEQKRTRFSIYSRQQDASECAWTEHASGFFQVTEPSVESSEFPEWIENASVVDGKTLYHVQDSGVFYGPAFQSVSSLYFSRTGSAAAWLEVADAIDTSAWIFHPTLLDGCFQTVGALMKQQNMLDGLYIPVKIGRFYMHQPVGDSVWCVVEQVTDNREIKVADLVFYDAEKRQVGYLESLQLHWVETLHLQEQSEISASGDFSDDWLYSIFWQQKHLYTQQGQIGLSVALKDVDFQRCILSESSHDLGLISQVFDQLSLVYVKQAFEVLGWSWKVGDVFSTGQLATDFAVHPNHIRLLNRMLEILSEAELLELDGEKWRVCQTFEPLDLESDIADTTDMLLAHFPETVSALRLLKRCGEKLADVITDRTDPIQLLFPGGDLSDTTAVYENMPEAQLMNRQMQLCLQSLIKSRPAYRGLRILEIGGGTGGTTSSLLGMLADVACEYTFTDISPSFTAKAKVRFSDYDFVKYQVLDIESFPQSQGFQLGDYDIIIAANVLHATQNMTRTMTHVKSLLAPGGVCLILEGTIRQRWLDLTFGMTTGWWSFQDDALRPDYPLMSSSQWQLLSEAVSLESFTLVQPKAKTSQAVILAQSPAVSEYSDHYLFLAEDYCAPSCHEVMNHYGLNCTVVVRGDAYCKIDAYNYMIREDEATDYIRLLQDINHEQGTQTQILYAWESGISQDLAENHPLAAVSQQNCRSLLYLTQAITSVQLPASLTFATQGAQPVAGFDCPNVAQSSLWGMAKVIAMEHPELHCRRIDLDPQGDHHSNLLYLIDELLNDCGDEQVALRDGNRYVARMAHYYHEKKLVADGDNCQLRISEPGNLSTMQYAVSHRRKPTAGEVEIEVKASGLNFMDVLDALGLYPDPRPGGLGGECAGVVVSVGENVEGIQVGDKVMAMAPGAFGRFVYTNAHLVMPIPTAMTFEAAATVPVAFLTAIYALRHVAQIQPGQRVLIHAAAGGVGMAAIQVVQACGGEVFATASPEKWPVLESLGVRHVMNSRTLDFAEQIMQETQGLGVDVVLNSLTGDFIPKSLNILAHEGVFVEIGKRDRELWGEEQIHQIRPDAHFSLIDLMATTGSQPQIFAPLAQMLSEGLEQGDYQPLPSKIFPADKAVQAFRFMQQARHTGKIVLDMQMSSAIQERKSGQAFLSVERSYLITGGLKGLGLLIAQWLVECGVRHIALIGRSAPDDSALSTIRALRDSGADVQIYQVDVTSYDEMATLFQQIDHVMPPLAGVIHAAGVLQDGVLSKQSWAQFSKVLSPKVDGAWLLHHFTQHMDLDMFTLFSSATALIGNAGQSNHAAANSFLDALAGYRHSLGLPGLSINWGAWSDVGSAASHSLLERIQMKGLGVITPQQGLRAFEFLCLPQVAHQVGVMPAHWDVLRQELKSKGRWSDFLEAFDVTDNSTVPMMQEHSAPKHNIREQLTQSAQQSHFAQMSRYLEGVVKTILQLDQHDSVTSDRPLQELGMDSLMAVELRNVIGTGTGLRLASTLLFTYPTIEQLSHYLLSELFPVESEEAISVPESYSDTPASLSDIDSITQISEQELEQMLGGFYQPQEEV